MDYVKGFVSIPILLAIGITDLIVRRFHPETDEEYLLRKYPGLMTKNWTDGTG